MLATIAPLTAVEAATEEPTVSFNTLRRQIDATVIVSLPLGATDPVCEAPLIAIPGPGQGSDIWTVIWTLVPGFGVISAAFKENGIMIPTEALPPRLWIEKSSQVPDHPDQWQVAFQNDVLSANSFHYDINAEATHAKDQKSLPIHHDPTIVVTQDPIG